MNTYLKRIPHLLCLLALTSCSTITTHNQPIPAAPEKTISWDDRARVLCDIKTWHLKGLIAVHAKNDAWSADWQWQQRQRDYTISLIGPLGSNAVQLAGTPSVVTLATSDGKTFTSPNPETLLEKRLGWRLPVSNLFYWIRGLPVPTLPARKQFDAANRLTILVQQDWRIEYLRYTTVHHVDLPDKMVLTNPKLSAKIIINQWSF